MARRKKNNNGAGASILVFLIVVSVIYGIVNCIVDFIKENTISASLQLADHEAETLKKEGFGSISAASCTSCFI